MATILIVEDEPGIQELVARSVEFEGHRTLRAASAEEAVDLVSSQTPDLVVLDWMLPGANGIEFARWLRGNKATRTVLIMMLTVRDQEEHKLAGLDAGADDYMTKPFSPRELNARVRSLLRGRLQQPSDAAFEMDGLRLELGSHRVSCCGRDVFLRPAEFRLLHFFMAHPERVYTRAQLLVSVWGDRTFVERRTVDVHVRRLRKVLEPYGRDRLIQTVRNTGYRFCAQN